MSSAALNKVLAFMYISSMYQGSPAAAPIVPLTFDEKLLGLRNRDTDNKSKLLCVYFK